jgi:DNA (cytosine-5)-methyltransferase 1
MIKVLNLYAGIGGNRKLWKDVEVTAVENNKKIAKIYQDFFPDDKVVLDDAHQYLLYHYKEFDFIWSSPPCPTHSHMNHFLNAQGCVRYPDMSLWQEIIFLNHFCKVPWVVENVKSYYEPFIKPNECERHYFWSNFIISKRRKNNMISITNCKGANRRTQKEHEKELQKYHDIDISKYNSIHEKGNYKLLANCVHPKLGLHVFNCAFKVKQQTLGCVKG